MASAHPVRDRAAIVGIGSSDFARKIGKTEQETALQVIRDACAEAGISTTEIDGIFKVDADTNIEVELARSLGVKNLRAWSEFWGGGAAACGPVIGATIAVATGMAKVAVAFRARNRGSGGRPWEKTGRAPRIQGAAAFEFPYGLLNPVGWIAVGARSYMARYGATSEQFARVCVTQRANAVHNPRALFRTPITVDDVLSSRMIADPIHLLDCCPETDAAMAVIVTSVERARDLRQTPAVIGGVAQGSNGRSQQHMSGIYSRDPHSYCSPQAAQDLYRMAGITANDVGAAMLYDMFSPVVLWGLETWGFCKVGEAGPFVESGGIDWDGKLPVNTHGGSLSEVYLHGFNHTLEAVRLIRGTSSRQPNKPIDNVLVTAAPIAPTTAFLVRKDPR